MDDYLTRKLTLLEFWVLVWLSINANPTTGKVKTSYPGLRADFRSKYTVNYLNKVVLSLRSKRYLGFPDHKGVRGSFIVELANYPLSNGQFLDISHCFSESGVRGSEGRNNNSQAEVGAENTTISQRLEKEKNTLTARFSPTAKTNEGRRPNNDNENKNKIIDNGKFTKVDEFTPNSHEESVCKKIAEKLGEEHMNFALSVRHKYGFALLERAWGIYKESDQKTIRNPGAYFNKIVANLIAKRENAQELH